jgi:hypothetical protein
MLRSAPALSDANLVALPALVPNSVGFGTVFMGTTNSVG